MTRCLIGAPLYYAEYGRYPKIGPTMNEELGIKADIMYITIEYPNYPIFSFLTNTQPRANYVNVLRVKYFFLH